MKRSLQAIVPVTIGALLGAGCLGTTYTPREPGRIHFLMNYKGDDVLEKDGQRYPLKEVGTSPELLAAFRGNPAAEQQARDYNDHQRKAVVLAIVTGVAFAADILCLALLATPSDRPDGPDYEKYRLGLGIATGVSTIGWVAAMFGAGREIERGNAHLYDAINVYNDSAGPAP
jgi:hypothetical protein